MLVVFLLLVLALLQQLHLFLEILLQTLVHLARSNAVNDYFLLLGRRGWRQGFCDFSDGLFCIDFFHFGEDHAFKLIDFVEIGHEYLYKLELELLLDEFSRDIRAVNQLDE